MHYKVPLFIREKSNSFIPHRVCYPRVILKKVIRRLVKNQITQHLRGHDLRVRTQPTLLHTILQFTQIICNRWRSTEAL